jgi:sporulation protein YlmC with PRC-barrel domain
MKISNYQLINLPVITESGQQLGTIESFNIDIDSQSILEYKIKPSSLVKEFISADLIIARGQIVEITGKKIVVKDSFSKDQSLKALAKLVKKKKESMVLNKE